MKYYNAKLRLGGKADNELMLEQMSAPEIQFMRRMHGPENVSQIEETSAPTVYDPEQKKMVAVEMDDYELFEFLVAKYPKKIEANGEEVNWFETIFGGKPLPQLISGALPKPKEQAAIEEAAAPALGQRAKYKKGDPVKLPPGTTTPGFAADDEDEAE